VSDVRTGTPDDGGVVVCVVPGSDHHGLPEDVAGVSLLVRRPAESEVDGLSRAAADSGADVVVFCRGERVPPLGWLDEVLRVLETDPVLAAVGLHPDPDGPAVLAVGFEGFAVRRELLVRAGGLDDRLGADGAVVDICWRLRLLGYAVRALPRQGDDTLALDAWDERERQRTTLVCAAKYLADQALAPFLAATIATEVRRSLSLGGVDATLLDLQRSPGGDDVGTVAVRSEGLEGARSVEGFVDLRPSLAVSREEVAERRRVPDRAIFPLLRHEVERGLLRPRADTGRHEVHQALGVVGALAEPLRVTIWVEGGDTSSPLRGDAAGSAPGDAAVSAEALVAALGAAGLAVDVVPAQEPAPVAESRAARADVVVVPGRLLDRAPWLPVLRDQVVVLDLGGDGADEVPAEILTAALRRADLVVCRSQDERDRWLGALAGMERVNAVVYDEDPSLDSLALVVAGTEPADLAALQAFLQAPRRAADLARAGDPLVEQGRERRAGGGQSAVARGQQAAVGLVAAVRRPAGGAARRLRRMLA
jgi:hypothetical protein